jgi:hypothetical protein
MRSSFTAYQEYPLVVLLDIKKNKLNIIVLVITKFQIPKNDFKEKHERITLALPQMIPRSIYRS